ncbi:hypothetical protein HY358_01020, partial [Candidatus Roizmanbacteria bacterium]|nr:hypothetical protein [Candidatus Roizmanbacteria bacterium]
MPDGSGPSPEEMGLTEKDRTPQFVREFSKQTNPQQRTELAREMREKRSEYFEAKKAQQAKLLKSDERTQAVDSELAAKEEEFRQTEALVAELSENWFSRTLNFLRLRTLSQNRESIQQYLDELNKQKAAVDAEEQQLRERGVSPHRLTEARSLLNDFYSSEKGRWSDAPYAKKDIQKYFSEEYLASLSLEEYVLLLQRFPSHMVTHVTRQGVRDHAGGSFHTIGLGEVDDGFVSILADRRLKSKLGTYLKDGVKYEDVKRFIRFVTVSAKDSAERRKMYRELRSLDREPATYSDFAAVHVAAEEVADDYYGGEVGNEIFFTFPSAHVVADHFFSGQLIEGGGSYWNDVWIWTDEDKGLSIDAGIVFIPSEAKVDRRTGSKYKLDENNRPVRQVDRIAAIQQFLDSPWTDELTNALVEHQRKLILGEANPEDAKHIIAMIDARTGITDVEVLNSLLEFNNL